MNQSILTLRPDHTFAMFMFVPMNGRWSLSEDKITLTFAKVYKARVENTTVTLVDKILVMKTSADGKTLRPSSRILSETMIFTKQ